MEGARASSDVRAAPCGDDAELQGEDVRLIELFFFAYRDFIADPDRLLACDGFGRPHHRVLHFASRSPGMSVARLLEILSITKQSLGPVLRDLIEGGHLEQRPNEQDRRQRLLYVTPKGRALVQHLTRLQAVRMNRALEAVADEGGGRETVERFLFAMIDPAERRFLERTA